MPWLEARSEFPANPILKCLTPFTIERAQTLRGDEPSMATTKVDPKLNEPNVAKKAKTYHGLSSQQLIDAYRIMFTSRRVDDREILLKRQQKVFFSDFGRWPRSPRCCCGFRPEAGLRLVLPLLP